MRKLLPVLFACLLASNIHAQSDAIEVKVTGKGEPLVFLPGFGCPGEVWDETVEKLKDNFACHVVSYAGFGSVAAIDTPWMKSIETAITSYIKRNHLKKAVLVGHSIGATFAMSIAASQCPAISKIVIVDQLPCIGAVMFPNFSPEMVVFDNPYNRQLLNMDLAAFRGTVSQMAAGMCQSKERQEQITGWMVNTDRKTYVYGYSELLKTDLRNRLPDVKVPALILASTLYPDREQIEKNYTGQYKTLPNKSVIMIDHAAHFIMFDQPETFLTELTGFLRN